MKFLTLDDVEVSSKTVFVRADLNCPVEDGVAQLSPRLVEHSKTLFELLKKGARVVVLAHQGRKGKSDFISLSNHAKMLSWQISKLNGGEIMVKFVADVCGDAAQDAIKSLSEGEVLLLENVRFVDSETAFEKTRKSEIVGNLSSLCDIFVLDAFSVAHRAQASVIGFSKCPGVAGRVMEKELEALSNLEKPKRPAILVLGGAKPSDSLPILRDWIKSGKADLALCGGAMGNLMLLASGLNIGKPSYEFLEKSGSLESLDSVKKFYLKNKSKLIIPSDVIVDLGKGAKTTLAKDLPSNFPILDIGPKTSLQFCSKIKSSGSIVLNGPMGVYEKEEFSSGTKSVFEAVSSSTAFSLLGGGHTLSALEKFGLTYSKFGYVSLSGKALIEYLSGEKLPGLALLEKSALSS